MFEHIFQSSIQINRLHSYEYVKMIMRKTLPVFITAFILSVLSVSIPLSPVLGADPVDPALRDLAKDHFDKAEFDKAFESYFELFRQDPGDPDINFNLGRAAFETGDYEAAIMAFERVLINRPDAVRAKLEIARSYYKLGSLESSEQYFQEVLAVNPPENVRSNINQYIKAIRQSKKEHFLSGKLSLGLDFDDNVNAAPTNSDIGINTTLGEVITVTVDRPEKDQIYTSMANLNYLYRPLDSTVSWKFSSLNYNAVYRDAKDLDVNLFDIKAGASIGRDRVVWDIYSLTNHLNQDYRQYLRTYGAGTTLGFAVTPSFLVSFDAKFKTKNYFESSDKDAKNIGLALSPVFIFGRNRLSWSLGWEYENARRDINTYTKLTSIASYEVRLPYEATVYISYWYQGTGYKDVYPLFGEKRNDDVQYISAGLSKTLSVWKSEPLDYRMDLNFNYTYTRSDSNIDLYAYTKNVVSANISIGF